MIMGGKIEVPQNAQVPAKVSSVKEVGKYWFKQIEKCTI